MRGGVWSSGPGVCKRLEELTRFRVIGPPRYWMEGSFGSLVTVGHLLFASVKAQY